MTLTYAGRQGISASDSPTKIEVRGESGRLVGMILQAPDGTFQFFRNVLALSLNPLHVDADLNRLKSWLSKHRDQI